MSKSAFWLIISSVIAAGAFGGTAARKPKQNPESTRRALSFLLAISDGMIPFASSCSGSYGQDGQARVKDLLAMELSSLVGGKNSLVGSCHGGTSCSINISHQLGEAVSSADISFKVKDRRALLDSLSCILSP